MNIVLLNSTHPQTPHISGVRASRFADELAKRGHKCIVLCPEQVGGTPSPPPGDIASHDWSRPFVAAFAEEAAVDGGKLKTLWNILRFGGNRTSFGKGAKARLQSILPAFSPDAFWVTMGPLETVVATRALAHSARCPWLFDIKDNIDIYLRRSLRWPVKQRIRGWSALQANSRLHGETASRWLKTPIETVYSGVDACFFERRKDPQLAATPYVTIVGSLYRPDLVREIVEGIAGSNRRTGRTLGIVHLGTQLAMLQEANTALGSPLSIQCPGYVSTDEMAAICQQAVANIYVFLGMTFHHKLFELLACDRPTIAYGGELPESIEEAHRLGKPLSTPQSTGQLAETLDQLEVAEHCSAPKASHPFFTWQEQAAKVERALERLMSA